jgi:hypothetical protein
MKLAHKREELEALSLWKELWFKRGIGEERYRVQGARGLTA